MKQINLRLLFTLCAALALHTGAFAGVLNGSCGDNATWSYDTDTQTLTISGTGAMYDYHAESDSRPWINYRNEIETVVIGDDITYIGSSSFREFESLQSVLIGEGVQSIGKHAFIIPISQSVLVLSSPTAWSLSAMRLLQKPT